MRMLPTLWKNKSYLSEGVFVNKEYSPEIERKRRVLLPILRAAKSIEGYKKQIRLENNKIVIKGKDYDIKNIHELPKDLNAFKVTSKENDTTVGFFGELNPLSNFFPASFQTKGQHYISSEQFIQASKAQYFGDIDIYNQIMGCKNSSDCKEFSRKISGVDHSKWETVAADICRIGIRDKFIQNPILMEILVWKTGTKCIVECANDRLWGMGIPLAHPDSLDSDRWITPGIMGKILEEIRLEFCSHYPPLPNSISNSLVFHHTNTSIGVPRQLIPPATSSSSTTNKNPTNPTNLRPSMFCGNKSNPVVAMTGPSSMDVVEDQSHEGPSASESRLHSEIPIVDETSQQQPESERDKEF